MDGVEGVDGLEGAEVPRGGLPGFQATGRPIRSHRVVPSTTGPHHPRPATAKTWP